MGDEATDDMTTRFEVLRTNSIQNRSLVIMRRRRRRIVKRRSTCSHQVKSYVPFIRPGSVTTDCLDGSFEELNTDEICDSEDGFTSDVSDYVTEEEKEQLIPDKNGRISDCVVFRKNSIQERLWKIRQLRRGKVTRSQIIVEQSESDV